MPQPAKAERARTPGQLQGRMRSSDHPLVAQIQMPLSGKYVGESAEDDDGCGNPRGGACYTMAEAEADFAARAGESDDLPLCPPSMPPPGSALHSRLTIKNTSH